MRAFEELVFVMITIPPLLFLAGVFAREIMEACDAVYFIRRFVRLLCDSDYRTYVREEKARRKESRRDPQETGDLQSFVGIDFGGTAE